MEEMAPSDTFVRAVERTLNVIRAFDADHPRLTLAEVAKRSGLGNATARRFLLTLQTLGYVRSEGRDFMLTPTVLTLGYSYLSAFRLPQVAQPHLEALSQQTGEATSIGLLDGDAAVYVGGVSTPRVMSLVITVGTRLPAFATSLGRVLLSHASPEELDHFFESFHPARYTAATIVSREQLEGELDKIREQGWCVVDEELGAGIRSVAVPVFRRSEVIAAINVTSTTGMVTRDRLMKEMLPLVQATAERISREVDHLPSL